MNKKIIVSALSIFLLAATTLTFAQSPANGKQKGNPETRGYCQQNKEICPMNDISNLTETQRNEIELIKQKYAKESLEFLTKIDELNARKTTLLTTKDEVTPELMSVIDQVGTTKKELAVLRTKQLMEIKSKLTPEQKAEMNQKIYRMESMKNDCEKGGMHHGQMHHNKKGNGGSKDSK